MPEEGRSQRLLQLLQTKTVVDLGTIQTALGGVSAMTCFRYLKQVAYRRSYNCNGRYYCLHEVSRYDRHGQVTMREHAVHQGADDCGAVDRHSLGVIGGVEIHLQRFLPAPRRRASLVPDRRGLRD